MKHYYTTFLSYLNQLAQFFKKEGYHANQPSLSLAQKKEKANEAINKTVSVVQITPLHVYAGFNGTAFPVDIESTDNLKLGDKLYVYGIEDNHTLLCLPLSQL